MSSAVNGFQDDFPFSVVYWLKVAVYVYMDSCSELSLSGILSQGTYDVVLDPVHVPGFRFIHAVMVGVYDLEDAGLLQNPSSECINEIPVAGCQSVGFGLSACHTFVLWYSPVDSRSVILISNLCCPAIIPQHGFASYPSYSSITPGLQSANQRRLFSCHDILLLPVQQLVLIHINQLVGESRRSSVQDGD